MLRFGRLDAHQRWHACDYTVVEDALGILQDVLRARFDVTEQGR